MQLLEFIYNICERYDIEFWLDYGVLLGSIRHEDFIPWDYDIAIGMMKNDLNKFLNVLVIEIRNHSLKNLLSVNKNSSTSFLKINLIIDESIKFDLVCLDVFPHDYTEEQNIELLIEKYEKIQKNC